MAIVAVYNYGTIHSCIVQNYQFKTSKRDTRVAPLACLNYGSVNNNIVQGFAKIGQVDNGKLHAYWLVIEGNTVVGANLRGNVFRAGEQGFENTENVYVVGSFPGWDLSVNQLQRLLQTDIWYVTFRTNKRFISTYYFTVDIITFDELYHRAKYIIES